MTHLLHVSDSHKSYTVNQIGLLSSMWILFASYAAITLLEYEFRYTRMRHLINERAVTGGKINVHTLERVSYLRYAKSMYCCYEYEY